MPSAAISSDLKKLAQAFTITVNPEFRGETTIVVDAASIKAVCRFCKEQLGYTYLVDLSGVDHLGEEPRFELVYELYQFERAEHLRIKTSVSEENLEVSTVSDIWETADWHEREAYDMYGFRFTGHPDLRRILMWDGFPHYPLRKDFPLAGKSTIIPELAFSEPAPLAGGPFVTTPTTAGSKDREPRSREF